MRSLIIRPIGRAAFAPYGWLVDADADGARAHGHDGADPAPSRRTINDGSSQRIDGLSPLAMDAAGGRPALAVFRAAARDPAGPWGALERHRLSSQTFVPLAGARAVVLVALGGDTPDESSLAAFLVSGRQAFTIRAGVWHHGLIALDAGDFIVLERQAEAVDCDVVSLEAPVGLRLESRSPHPGLSARLPSLPPLPPSPQS